MEINGCYRRKVSSKAFAIIMCTYHNLWEIAKIVVLNAQGTPGTKNVWRPIMMLTLTLTITHNLTINTQGTHFRCQVNSEYYSLVAHRFICIHTDYNTGGFVDPSTTLNPIATPKEKYL